MRHLILIFAIVIISGLSSQAQVSSYVWTQSAPGITYLSGAYTEHATGETDFGTYEDIPIGFTFNFNGVNYTSVSICNDGWIAMGATLSSSTTPLSTGTTNNVIAGLAADLDGLTTGSLRSMTLGTAPNRTFVVEWQHYEKWLGADDYSFQIILHETSNVIDVKFAASTTVADNTFQVGLRGGSSADFNNRTKAAATAWSGSAAGTANTDVMTTGGNAARNPQGMFTWTPVNMSYVSCTTTQTNTNSVAPGETNREIIGIEIVTTGTNNPLSATSFTFSTAGSTAPLTDIQNARLWYTGNSNTFAATTQVGSAVASPNGAFTINGFTQGLAGGTNYFWLTYDIRPGATINDFADASCTSLTAGGSARTPSTTAPAGNRQILNITTVGTGTSTQTYPFYTNYGYTRSASIYTAAELGSAGNISHLGWYVSTATAASIPIKIYMKSTNDNVLTSQTWADLIAGATLVYNSNATFTPVGWKTFDITDFTYCTGNVMVLCEANYGGTGTTSPSFQYTTQSSYMHEYFYQDNTAPTGTGYTSYSRPNIQFTKTAPTNCSGTPTAGTVTATPSSVTNCSTPIVLSSSGYSATCGMTYQWQWSPDNVTWSDIPGATTIPFSATPIGSQTYYRLIVTCSYSGASSTSSAVSVTGTAASGGFNYNFTALSGSYTSIGGTTIHAAAVDDVTSSGIPIGFTFNYCCQPYTTVSVSSNGWLSFNSTTSSNASNDLEGYTNVVAPLWDDLQVYTGGAVTYTTTGTAPNRVFTVQWSTMEWYYSSSADVISFQVKLYETSNRIDFVYRQGAGAVSSGSASIGLSGGSLGSFLSLDGTGTSPNASAITETTTLNTKPANGQIYRWDVAGCSGTPSAGTITSTPATGACVNSAVTLNASGYTASCDMSYTWQSSTDNVTWSDMLGCNFSIPTTVTPTANPTYYRLEATCGGSGLSGYSNVLPISILSAPANDLPCNATPLALGGIETGDNSCSSGTGEPASATCWTNGSMNTVWYSVVAPASGSIKFRTTLGTLTNTQIALYTGACGSGMTMVASACNDNQATCGTSTYYNSDLSVTGLTPGLTYYLSIDGYNSLTGTFTIMAIDGVNTWPGMPGQDCGLQIPVCSNNFTVGDPGYQAVGANCDFSSTNICLASGERGSVWYTIPITSSGTLMFVITPNDLGAAAGDETDYDFGLWKTTGAAPVATCASILAGNAAIPPVACNYSFLGVTGCYTGGNYSLGAMNFDAAFEVPVTVTAGEVYTLVISNFSNSTSGFNINLVGGTATIGYPAPGTVTSLTWTGGAGNTDWFNPLNWGNCNTEIPSPTIDAIIPPSSANMPIINAAGAQCKSLTINSFASLGILAGFSLEVYGNLTNYGTMNLNDNSTVQMTGTANQTMEGNLSGTSAFGHFTVNKSSASTVTFLQDLTADGNFTTSNSNSDIDANGKLVKVGGHINLANNTYSYGTNGEMQLINGNAQNITTNNNAMFNFTMQKTSNSATLLTDLTVVGTLTLNSGIINTGTFRVICTSTNASYITGHNILSYINGNLRKYIANNTSTYSFPMGTATAYRLAQMKNNNLTGISYLDVKFVTPFTNTGAINTAICQDFGTPYDAICSEGVWQIDPNAAPGSGSYNIYLWFDGGGANAFAGLLDNSFGPVKRPSASTLASAWSAAPGTLNAANGAGRMVADGYALRNNVTSFSQHAIAYVTSPLPVSLLDFNTDCRDQHVLINWTVADEINVHYYLVQKSVDGITFTDIARIDAHGNSNSVQQYSVEDLNNGETNTYRVLEFDYDGQEIQLATGVASCSADGASGFAAWFNSETDQVAIRFDCSLPGTYTLNLFDANGRIVATETINAEHSGTITGSVDAENLSFGLYNVVLVGPDGTQSAKTEVY